MLGESGSAAALLVEELQRLHLDLPSNSVSRISRYLVELDRWNRTVNLTALKGRMRIRRLVSEPIWIGKQVGVGGACMDIGSGNGSPAIPLSLALPVSSMILLEPRLRRAAFLRQVLGSLGIKGEVRRVRVEDLDQVESLSWVTIQGVALTTALIDALKRVCSLGTNVVWITSGAGRLADNAQLIRIPDSDTEAWVFKLGAASASPDTSGRTG
jgi:16S rRNA G527 N7-methylase RsmG